MAYNDSGEIPASQSTYSLGGYTFELKVQNVHEPGEEEVVSVFAVCHSPDGNRETVPMDFPVGTTVESWSVEANETEASVYTSVKANPTIKDVNLSEVGSMMYSYLSSIYPGIYWPNLLVWADFPARVFYDKTELNAQDTPPLTLLYYPEKDIWYGSIDINGQDSSPSYGPVVETESDKLELLPQGHASEGNLHTVLIGRFAIDLHEADPENWDEPPSTGDPSYTLNVYVTGASAGTHNSENIPLDGEIQSVYGSGGNGGNGGGGGAGASTVIIYEFTTDKAGNVNQEAYAREAGAGSPGGPGGRGADGCIIIFY